ncbi:MAG: hypothetical protein Q7S74_06285 [Nanoarchaeota archaeon]|nr:hypothetical protein [Nanoarchaeota archaeon]
MVNEGFAYGGFTILSSPIFVEAILPFLLVFTIVFAILQKSKILGENKRQIDAIVSLVIGLLVISFGRAVGIIVQLIPFLAVSLVIILVLMLMLGFFNKEGDWDAAFPKGLRRGLAAVAIVALIVAVVIITGAWPIVYNYIISSGGSSIFINVLFIIIIIGAIAAVLYGGGKKSS